MHAVGPVRGHLLERNLRHQEDLADQLINPSEKRLARLLMLLAEFDGTENIIPKVSQVTLAEMVGPPARASASSSIASENWDSSSTNTMPATCCGEQRPARPGAFVTGPRPPSRPPKRRATSSPSPRIARKGSLNRRRCGPEEPASDGACADGKT